MDADRRSSNFLILLIVGKKRIPPWAFLGAWIFAFLIQSSCGFAVEVSTFGGGEIDTHGQGFSYLGLEVSQNINETLSISGRVIPNYLAYQYFSGGTKIRASSPGLYAVAGGKFSWGQTKVSLFGGAEFRNTDLSPDDQNAKLRGGTSAGTIQGEFDTWFRTRTNVNVYASFSGTDGFSFERGRIKQQVTNLDYKKANTLNIGLEQFYGRNPDFHMAGGGLVLEIFHIPQWLAFSIRGGYKRDSTFGNGAYGGMEFYKKF